ncbi:hypothetical protein ACN9MY_10705 [Pseudoduganella sp. R-31]|uniref:hypothetical protein n=1 Tax=Pseudoduganella sp. R-31 TaxID=3404060 RepID=UPI003CE72E12
MITSLLINLFILFVAAVAWIAILWFGITLNFARWSAVVLIVMHVAPPLLAWGGWRLLRQWRSEDQEKEDEAAIKQQANMEAAQLRHEQECSSRRSHCECRAIVMQAKALAPETLFDIDLPNVVLQLAQPKGDESDVFEAMKKADPALAVDGFAPLIYDTLQHLYDKCPASIALPIYVVASDQIDMAQMSAGLGRIRKEIAEAMEPVSTVPNDPAFIRLLHVDGNIADAVLSVFENDSALPGAVILAFDSPLVQAQKTGSGATPQERWAGPPGQGVIALLMTPAGLSPLPVQSTQEENRYSGRPSAEQLAIKLLAEAYHAAREQLIELPVMAQIRRGTAIVLKPEAPARPPALHNALSTLLERAKAHAGWPDQPSIADGEAVGEPAASDSANRAEDKAECGWLIHNAGSVSVMGARLAATATAMNHHKMNVDPLEKATNVAIVLGDFGKANGVGMLALSAMQSAMLKQPVMCTEFNQDESVAMFFVAPPFEKAPQDVMQEAA